MSNTGLAGMVLCVAAAPLFASDSPDSKDIPANVDAYISKQMQRHQIPALSLIVLHDGKVLQKHDYGVINLELDVPNRAGSAFMIGSMSKQFAAAATMVLVEQKKIALDDPVSQYLPGLPIAWSTVTVRQLLTHTSGITSYTDVDAFETYNAKEATHDEVIATVRNLPMNFPPGERFQYNNTGYFLLGMMIEKITGESYGQFLTEHIFAPAGMTDSRLNTPAQIVHERVPGYSLSAGKLVNPHFQSMTWPYSGGAVISTITDLAKWDAAMYRDDVLSQSAFKQMWTPMRLNDGTVAQYGFGWHLEQLRNHLLVWHTGHIDGFSSFFGRLPDLGLSVILLTNQEDLDPDLIGEAVLAFYDSSLTPPEMLEPAISDPDAARTARVLEAAHDLAIDNRKSPWITAGLRENTTRGQRASMLQLLNSAKSFRFLACDAALPANATRLGSPVALVCYYRLTTVQGAVDWTIFLTPDGKVADGRAHSH